MQPAKALVLTWASASKYDDKSEHSRVTFELEPFEDMVRLTVTHDELNDGGDMARMINNGWPRVLSSMKSFLETGKAIDMSASPKNANK